MPNDPCNSRSHTFWLQTKGYTVICLHREVFQLCAGEFHVPTILLPPTTNLMSKQAVHINKYISDSISRWSTYLLTYITYLLTWNSQVSGSKIWQMERTCNCCQESGEREATVVLFCPDAKNEQKRFRKVFFYLYHRDFISNQG